jgi:hypothetical protein
VNPDVPPSTPARAGDHGLALPTGKCGECTEIVGNPHPVATPGIGGDLFGTNRASDDAGHGRLSSYAIRRRTWHPG